MLFSFAATRSAQVFECLDSRSTVAGHGVGERGIEASAGAFGNVPVSPPTLSGYSRHPNKGSQELIEDSSMS